MSNSLHFLSQIENFSTNTNKLLQLLKNFHEKYELLEKTKDDILTSLVSTNNTSELILHNKINVLEERTDDILNKLKEISNKLKEISDNREIKFTEKESLNAGSIALNEGSIALIQPHVKPDEKLDDCLCSVLKCPIEYTNSTDIIGQDGVTGATVFIEPTLTSLNNSNEIVQLCQDNINNLENISLENISLQIEDNIYNEDNNVEELNNLIEEIDNESQPDIESVHQEEEEEEYIEVTICGVTYCTTDETNGFIYELNNDEVGKVVGKYDNGLPTIF